MNCRRVQDKLSEYIDGELSVAEAGQVMAHLAACEECRSEEMALRRTIGLTQAWGVRQPGPELEWRLDPAVLARRADEETRSPWIRRLGFVLAPAMTTAAAALLVAVFWPRVQPGPPQPPRPETVVPSAVVAPPAAHREARVERPAGRRVAAAPIRPGRSAAEKQVPQARGKVQAAVHRHAGPRWAPRHNRQRTMPRVVAAADRLPAATRQMEVLPRPAAPRSTDPMPTPEPISLSQTMYASGRYAEAISVLNAVFERTASRFTDQERALLTERNALADSTIVECSAALRADPGNANARKFLDEAYEAKVALVRSLAG